ncbi:MAG: NifB/NifX family molybdenum-iron cluster-binding protein [Gammaproteobacteria bacterium]|nr:NifB/NifX family molybdenum-iron cluster-binding protein [Gammaproteobacteria bacterium]
MKVAFVYCDDRIAPVFDVAQQVCLVEMTAGKIAGKTTEALPNASLMQKARRLSELNIEVLICGAISRPLYDMVNAYGIQIISFIAGRLDEIVDAWIAGKLDANVYAMPGCCRGRRAGNKNRRQNFVGKGSMRRNQVADAVDYCVCIKCGHRQPHQRGLRCCEQFCSLCGHAMTSE